jgi:hypothetical protein
MKTLFIHLGSLSRLALLVAAFKIIGWYVVPLVISSFAGRYLHLIQPAFLEQRENLLTIHKELFKDE